MSDYTPQDMRNLLLRFYPGIYTPQNMGGVVLSFSPTVTYSANLSAYLRGLATNVANIQASITAVSAFSTNTKNLQGLIYGWATKDLLGYLYSIEPADLQAILNVFEIGVKDLSGFITGEWLKGTANLVGGISKVFLREYKNLQGILYIEGGARNLQGIINIIFTRDLPASLSPLRLIDLPAYIFSGGAAVLYALIHGFDTKDLGGYLSGGYGPGDLQASIYAIPHQNITAYIRGWKGIEVPFDLRAYVIGGYVSDLQAQINIIQAINLIAYLNAIGGSVNLNATIIPKVILIRKSISIALLEHKDLIAMVNYRCQLSKAVDLSAYLYPLMKKDLPAYIMGWYGSTSDNLSDLAAYINAANYDVQDKLEFVGFVPQRRQDRYTSLRVRFGVRDKYTVFDDIEIIFGTRYKNLAAYITGVLTSVNLPASLTPVWDWNYRELPSWVLPKTHEVVINLEKLEEQWQRFVEIMFDHNSEVDYHYFYVGATQKVYRVERDSHWTIWVKSYITDDESIIDRKNVRSKYGFKMSNYSTMDEAIRDLIDRVSAYRKIDLPASINVLGLTKYKDLSAYLIPKIKYIWSSNLNASITVI